MTHDELAWLRAATRREWADTPSGQAAFDRAEKAAAQLSAPDAPQNPAAATHPMPHPAAGTRKGRSRTMRSVKRQHLPIIAAALLIGVMVGLTPSVHAYLNPSDQTLTRLGGHLAKSSVASGLTIMTCSNASFAGTRVVTIEDPWQHVPTLCPGTDTGQAHTYHVCHSVPYLLIEVTGADPRPCGAPPVSTVTIKNSNGTSTVTVQEPR